MLKTTIAYKDFDGNDRVETHYFNLTNTETAEVAFDLLPNDESIMSEDDQQTTSNILDKLGNDGLFKFVKELILRSYGIKSSDGRRFEKSKEISTEFSQTLAFDKFFTDLLSDDVAAANFINAVLPMDAVKEILKNKESRVSKIENSNEMSK